MDGWNRAEWRRRRGSMLPTWVETSRRGYLADMAQCFASSSFPFDDRFSLSEEYFLVSLKHFFVEKEHSACLKLNDGNGPILRY